LGQENFKFAEWAKQTWPASILSKQAPISFIQLGPNPKKRSQFKPAQQIYGLALIIQVDIAGGMPYERPAPTVQKSRSGQATDQQIDQCF
jgi:hypothetical protein